MFKPRDRVRTIGCATEEGDPNKTCSTCPTKDRCDGRHTIGIIKYLEGDMFRVDYQDDTVPFRFKYPFNLMLVNKSIERMCSI